MDQVVTFQADEHFDDRVDHGVLGTSPLGGFELRQQRERHKIKVDEVRHESCDKTSFGLRPTAFEQCKRQRRRHARSKQQKRTIELDLLARRPRPRQRPLQETLGTRPFDYNADGSGGAVESCTKDLARFGVFQYFVVGQGRRLCNHLIQNRLPLRSTWQLRGRMSEWHFRAGIGEHAPSPAIVQSYLFNLESHCVDLGHLFRSIPKSRTALSLTIASGRAPSNRTRFSTSPPTGKRFSIRVRRRGL